MKKLFIVTLSIFFLIAGVFMDHYLINPSSGMEKTGVVLAEDTGKSSGNGTWVAKINDYVISREEFQREFAVHVYSLPFGEEKKEEYRNNPENKRRFLSNLVHEHLIHQQALEKGYDKKQLVQDLIKAVTRRAIIQVYLNEQIEPKLQDIPEQQIEQIYNKNKQMFAGMDIDTAGQQIKMQLLQRQYNQHLEELIDELKGEARVVKNDDVDL
ncbi:MAG: SurA N-terminal domain-containing protein [Spirochaetota bacterium]